MPELPDDSAVHLRPKLLRAEEHEAEISAALGEVEQHLSDVGVLSIVRRILVQLVDEHDDVVDAEIALLEVLAELGDDAREDQILRGLLEGGDVDHVHRAILKAPEGQVADGAVVGHQTGAARRDVRQPVADLSDGRDVVRPPALVVLAFHARRARRGTTPRGRRTNGRDIVCSPSNRIAEVAVDDALADEVDQRIGLRVDVVLVEQHLGVLQHFAQSPRERRHVVQQRLVRSQRVERHAVGLVRREVLHVLERPRRNTTLLVEHCVGVVDLAGLIEEAEVGTLHVEADRRDRSLLLRKVREDRAQDPFDRARLRREAGHAGDVQVRRFGSEEKIGIEVDRRVGAAGAIHADRNSGARSFLEIAVHAQRDGDVGVVGEKDLAHRHRLQRLLGQLAQHRGRVETNLRALGRRRATRQPGVPS